MKRLPKNYIYYLIAFVILYGIEAFIVMRTSGWIRGYIGDVLVIPLLYCLIRMFTDALPRILPVCLFGIGCLAEFLQFIRIHEILSIPEGTPFGIIIGTRADWIDVLCYAVGTLGILVSIHIIKSIRRQKGEHHDRTVQ